MMSFRGQASWVKMMSPGGIGMPADQKSKKADQLIYLYTNIGLLK
jgi:hypothetical protein